MRIHQLNSALAYGDAITNHTFEMGKVLRKWGFDTYIFSEIMDGNKVLQKAESDKIYKKYMNFKEDLLIFHYSVHCENANLYKNSKNIKIFEYHNITPEGYFNGYDGHTYLICKRGRNELKSLTNCKISLGDSEYSRRELVQCGFDDKKSDVLPIFINFEKLESICVNKNIFKKFSNEFVNILFVGRVAPNKRIEDLIKIFYIYNRFINKKSRLFIVGSRFLKKYDEQLDQLVKHLKLNNVIFTNKVSLSDLKTYYKLANVFLCMSEHEGFCVPLIEAMHFKIPIISYSSTAIPYTLKDAGILVNKKSYAEVAELIDILVNDKNLSDRIIRKQDERLEEFDRQCVERKLLSIIEKAIT